MSSIDSACRHAHQPKINLGIRATLLSAFVAALMLASGATRAQRDCCQAEWWNKWTTTERERYVLGYTTGFEHGFIDGCNRGTKDWPVEVKGYDNLPINKCLSGQRDFSKQSDLATEVTEFYRRYPEDDTIFPHEILDLLGQGLTLEQIHKYWSGRYSGPRKNP